MFALIVLSSALAQPLCVFRGELNGYLDQDFGFPACAGDEVGIRANVRFWIDVTGKPFGGTVYLARDYASAGVTDILDYLANIGVPPRQQLLALLTTQGPLDGGTLPTSSWVGPPLAACGSTAPFAGNQTCGPSWLTHGTAYDNLNGTACLPNDGWPFLWAFNYAQCGTRLRVNRATATLNCTSGVLSNATYVPRCDLPDLSWAPTILSGTYTQVCGSGTDLQVSWKTAGCFEGYLTEADCFFFTKSDQCFQTGLPDQDVIAYAAGAATLPDFSNYRYLTGCVTPTTKLLDGGRWCPMRPSTASDPVTCTQLGVVSIECEQDWMAGVPVNGDTLFCAQFGCDVSSTCVCSFMYVISVQSMIEDDPSAVLTPMDVPAIYPYPDVSAFPEFVTPKIAQDTVYCSVASHVVTVISSLSVPYTAILTKDLLSMTTVCGGGTCVLDLPDTYFVSSGTLTVQSMIDGVITASGQCTVVGESNCLVYDCVFCAHTIQNFDCLPASQKAAFVIIMIILCCIAIILLFAVCFVSVKVFRWVFCCYQYGKSMKVTHRLGSLGYSGFSWFRPETTVVLLSVVALVSACDRTGILSSQDTTCTPGVSGTTCSVLPTMALSFSAVGQTSCVWLNGTGSSGARIEVSLDSAWASRQLIFQYMTSSFSAVTNSTLKCNGCLNSQGCSAQTCTGVSDRTGAGTFNNAQCSKLPGQTSCVQLDSSVVESWSSTCVGCFPNCGWTCWGLLPTGNVFSVFSVGPAEISLYFTIRRVDSTGSSVIGTFSSLVPSDFSLATVTVNAASVSVTPEWPSGMNVISEGGYQTIPRVGPTSAKRNPTVGTIGDIQSLTYAGLTTPGPNSFIYDPLIFQGVERINRNLVYSFSDPGVLLAGSLDTIPYTYGGFTWNVLGLGSQAVLATNITGPVQSQVVISFNAAQNFTFSSDLVCPDSFEVAASGCVNCPLTGSITLTSRSTCKAGLVKVTLSGQGQLLVSQVILTTQATQVEVPVTWKGSGDFELCLVGYTSTCASFSFTPSTFFEAGLEQLGLNTSVTALGSGSNDAFTGWLDSLATDTKSWWKWLLWGLLLLVCLVAAGSLIWFTAPVWWPVLLALVRLGTYKKALEYFRNRRSTPPPEKEEKPSKSPDNDFVRIPLGYASSLKQRYRPVGFTS